VSRTILVSNRLPVRVDASGRVTRTTGGLTSALSGAGVTSEGIWVGWPGTATEAIPDQAALRTSMTAMNAAPVLLTEAELDGFYEGYSNATLWPVLHNQINQARFRGSAWFPAYQEVNQRFADAVLAVAKDGDTIWIHDYHLFLLPDLIRRANRKFRIGFFLHTPFPSSETFRTLPERSALLTGLLGERRRRNLGQRDDVRDHPIVVAVEHGEGGPDPGMIERPPDGRVGAGLGDEGERDEQGREVEHGRADVRSDSHDTRAGRCRPRCPVRSAAAGVSPLDARGEADRPWRPSGRTRVYFRPMPAQ
jgi:hypothetical protein